MNLDQFVQELANETDQRKPKAGLLAGDLLRLSEAGCIYCPLTYVAEKMTGKYFKVEHFDEAAEAIGLPYSDAYKVSQAADNAGNCYAGEALAQLEGLRRRLLAACNVTESDTIEKPQPIV